MSVRRISHRLLLVLVLILGLSGMFSQTVQAATISTVPYNAKLASGTKGNNFTILSKSQNKVIGVYNPNGGYTVAVQQAIASWNAVLPNGFKMVYQTKVTTTTRIYIDYPTNPGSATNASAQTQVMSARRLDSTRVIEPMYMFI